MVESARALGGSRREIQAEDKLKIAEKKRRLRELMDPGATSYLRAENQAEKEVEQTKHIGRKWRGEGPKGPGYYLSYVAVAGQLLALAEQDEITELVQEVKMFEPEGRHTRAAALPAHDDVYLFAPTGSNGGHSHTDDGQPNRSEWRLDRQRRGLRPSAPACCVCALRRGPRRHAGRVCRTSIEASESTRGRRRCCR